MNEVLRPFLVLGILASALFSHDLFAGRCKKILTQILTQKAASLPSQSFLITALETYNFERPHNLDNWVEQMEALEKVFREILKTQFGNKIDVLNATEIAKTVYRDPKGRIVLGQKILMEYEKWKSLTDHLTREIQYSYKRITSELRVFLQTVSDTQTVYLPMHQKKLGALQDKVMNSRVFKALYTDHIYIESLKELDVPQKDLPLEIYRNILREILEIVYLNDPVEMFRFGVDQLQLIGPTGKNERGDFIAYKFSSFFFFIKDQQPPILSRLIILLNKKLKR